MRHLPANINQVFLLLIKCAVPALCIYFIYLQLNSSSGKDYFVSFIYEKGLVTLELLVLFLMVFSFFNWCAEAVKWKWMMSKTIHMNFRQSLKAVLAGLAVGFITPARTGDVVGRWINVSNEKKSSALAVFFYSSVFQTMVTLFTGTVAFVFLLMIYGSPNPTYKNAEFPILITAGIMTILVFYLALSATVHKKTSGWKWFRNRNWLEQVNYPLKEKLNFLLISFIRYVFFMIQFVVVLYVFDVHDDIYYLIFSVAVIYLISFFLPSVIAGKLGVREAVAVLVLSGTTDSDLQIVTASLVIWIFNLAIPALTGAVIIYRHPFPPTKNKTTE